MLLAVIAAFLIMPALPFAGGDEAAPPPAKPAPPAAKPAPAAPGDPAKSNTDTTNSATLNEEEEISDLIAEADKESGSGDWKNAAMLYQQAAEKVLSEFPSCVYKSKVSAGAGLDVYVSALEYCRKRLLEMDEEALKAYRSKFETAAEQALDQAAGERNLAKMAMVGERYPATKSGLKALISAGDLSSERRDFAFAARCYRKATSIEAAFRAGDEMGYALLLAKAARVYALLGWDSDVNSLKEDVAADADLAALEIQAYGKKVTLGSFLDEMAKSVTHVHKTAVNGYPIIGGDSSHAMIMPGGSGPLGGLKWKYEQPMNPNVKSRWTDLQNKMSMLPSILAPMPVIDEREVLIALGNGALALSEADGKELYRFPVGAGNNPRNPDEYSYYYGFTCYYACTIHDGVVYLSTSAYAYDGMGGRVPRGALFAVDAATGKQIWDSTTTSSLPKDEAISGAPVVFGGKLIFATHKGGSGETDSYMNCVDAKTGKLEWRCYIASGFSNNNRWNPYGNNQVPDAIAMEGDTAVICSSAGVIAAVDARVGQLMWAAKYAQDLYDTSAGGNPIRPQNSYRPWCYNYPIAVNGHIIVLPQDSTRLYCLDVATGEVKWMKKLPDMCYLAGVDDSKVFVIEKCVMVIDEKTGKLLNPRKELQGIPAGRPALTKTDLYISTMDSLLRFDRQTQEVTEVLKWADQGLWPGNLLFNEEALYVVNMLGIAAFNGPGLIDRLSKEIAKDPDNSTLLYRRGEALVGGKDYNGALTDLSKALALAKADSRYGERLLRDLINEQLFKCYMAFSTQSAADKKSEEALKYAKLALQSATNDEARLAAWLNLGTVNEKSDEEPALRAAIAAYQKVISDFPQAFSKTPGALSQSSATLAAGHIDSIISAHGRALYSEVEAHAVKALADAEQAGSLRAYFGVYEQYPNSLTSFEALMRAAKRFEEEKSNGMVVAVLNIACERATKAKESIPANLKVYRLALDRGDYYSAGKALQRLAAMPPEYQADIDGKSLSVAAYAQEKMKELDASSALGASSVPLNEKPEPSRTIKLDDLSFGGKYVVRNELLDPDGRRPAHLADKLLIKRNSCIECWNPETGEKVWTTTSGAAWLGVELAPGNDGSAVIQTVVPGQAADRAGLRVGDAIRTVNGKPVDSLESCRNMLAALKSGDRVKVNYTRGNEARQADLVLTAMPTGLSGSIVAALFTGDGNIILKTRDQNRPNRTEIKCINGKTGETLWARSVMGTNNITNNALLGQRSKDLIGVVDTDNTGSWILILEPSNGKAVARIPLKQKGYIGEVVVGADTVAIMEVNPYVCHLYDLLTGAEKGRLELDANVNNGTTPVALVGTLLAFPQDGGFAAVDLNSGAVVYKQADKMNFYQIDASDRFIVTYTQNWPQAVIVDFMSQKLVKTIQPGMRVQKATFYGGLMCLVGWGNNIYAASLYDARTGDLLCGQLQVGQEAGYGKPFRIAGDYLVVTSANQVQGDGKQGPTTTYTVRVVNYRNNRELYRFEQGGAVAPDAAVVNGKICILQGDEIKVIK
jgi:outer membrane protein assembly factor BamB